MTVAAGAVKASKVLRKSENKNKYLWPLNDIRIFVSNKSKITSTIITVTLVSFGEK